MKSDLRSVANKLESYFADQQLYPTSLATVTNGGTIGNETVQLSTGNAITVRWTALRDAYCLNVTDNKGTHAWVYRSEAGGLQDQSVVTCSIVTYPAAA
jgi:hypothetical protein